MPNLTELFNRLNSNRQSKKGNILEMTSKTAPACLISGSFDSAASTTVGPCCATRKASKSASLNTNMAVNTDIKKLTTTSLNSLNDAVSNSMGFSSFFRQNRSRFSKHKKSTKEITKKSLPESILLKCVDLLENPFEICSLSALNSAVREHCKARLNYIVEMDVRKCNFDEIVFDSSRYWIGNDSRPWFRHPGGHKIFMRFVNIENRQEPSCVEILVDECWSSRDVARLCRILNVFRGPLKRIQLDASIIELVRFLEAILTNF